MEAEVIAIREYPSFKVMLLNEPIDNVLPGISEIDEALSIYRRFYSEDEERKFGVVAIEIRLLP